MASGTTSTGLGAKAEFGGGAKTAFGGGGAKIDFGGGAAALTPDDIGSPINAMSNFFGMEEGGEEDMMDEVEQNHAPNSRIDLKVANYFLSLK